MNTVIIFRYKVLQTYVIYDLKSLKIFWQDWLEYDLQTARPVEQINNKRTEEI